MTAPHVDNTTPNRAVIFHGYHATPNDHWFGRLAERLESDGISTTIPALPDPQRPLSTEWDRAVRTAIGALDENAVVVAHSLGCLTVLRHLQSVTGPWRLGALVLVAGFLDRLPALPELDGFIGDGCDVDGLRSKIRRIVVMRSDNDTIVPPGHTDRLAGLLGVSAQVVPGAGHFLTADGVSDLPVAHAAIVDGQ